MKRLSFYFIVSFMACTSVHAQDSSTPSPSKLDEYMEAGMEVAGVRAPYYDEEGNLFGQLYGGFVKVLEGGVADVSQLRIDVFEGKQVFMTVYAPQCFSKVEEVDGRKILSVYSDGDVLIDLEQMTIIGRGFQFSSKQNKFEILHDSKVLVKESARTIPGVEL